MPLAAWLLVVAQTVWMLGVAVVYPAFQAPDEAAHLDYVLAHKHGEWLAGPGERRLQEGVLRAFGSVPPTASERHQSDVHTPVPRSERRSVDELGTGPAPPSSLPNQMVQHPPGYYALAAGWTWLIPGFDDLRFDLQVFWLRVLSTLLLAPVPLLLFLTGRRLLQSDGAALIAAVLPLSLPTYLRTGASVNNDALLVLEGAALALLLSRVLGGDLRRRTAALVGVTWAAMLLTKGLALVLPPVIVAAYLAAATGNLLARVRTALVPAALAGVTGVALGGWWWVRNLAVHGNVQPRGYGADWPPESIYGLTPGASNREFVREVAWRLVKRTFGSLGLIDGPVLPVALVTTLFVLAALALLRGLQLGLPGAVSPRSAGLVLLLPTLLCLFVIVVQVHAIYWRSRVFPGLQLRYVLPFLAGLVLPAALALHRLAGRFRRWAPAAVVTLATAYAAGALLWYLAHQFGSAGGGAWRALSSGTEYAVAWAPWPHGYVVVCGVAAVASAAALAVASAGLTRGRLDEPVR